MNKQINGKTETVARPPIKLGSPELDERFSILAKWVDISLIDNGLS